jgi:N-glycosylase/DNA lyase
MKKIHDSPSDIENILIEGYRKMTPQQKMQRVSELNKAVQQLALARIQRQYGDISEREKKLRLASLWLDRETMIRDFAF